MNYMSEERKLTLSPLVLSLNKRANPDLLNIEAVSYKLNNSFDSGVKKKMAII